VWISAIVGVVMMLIGMNFARWAITTLFGGTYQTNMTWQVGERAGQMVTYWDLQGFTALQDCAIFLFGLAMVLEAIVLLVVHSRIRSKRPLLAFALTITLVATILNLVVAARLFGIGVLPLLSLLAVAFGGYIAAYEWRLYRHSHLPAPRA
jgi:xanthine/uracil permease